MSVFNKNTHRVLSYNTIRYDSGYLTCSKKLTGSQLSLPMSYGSRKRSYDQGVVSGGGGLTSVSGV